jgi:primosomal protein N'
MDPAHAPVYQIKSRYRWRLIVKGPDMARLTSLVTPVVDRLDFAGVAVALDFDPYNLM